MQFLARANAQKSSMSMFKIRFSEGGKPLSQREWPVVPRVGETITLRDSAGLFEVIRVHWQEYDESTGGLTADVSLRSTSA